MIAHFGRKLFDAQPVIGPWAGELRIMEEYWC